MKKKGVAVGFEPRSAGWKNSAEPSCHVGLCIFVKSHAFVLGTLFLENIIFVHSTINTPAVIWRSFEDTKGISWDFVILTSQ